MGFNKRKMDDARRQEAENEAAARHATDRQILEDAEQLVTAWNERQANRMPMLFSPTIGAAITAGYWFLRARCPTCRTTGAVDLRTLDWHCGAAVTALTPALSCRSCRPNAPFAELVRLSRSSVAHQSFVDHTGAHLTVRVVFARGHEDAYSAHRRRLLRACGKRPCRYDASDKRDEFTPHHGLPQG